MLKRTVVSSLQSRNGSRTGSATATAASVKPAELRGRREKLLKSLNGAVGLVYAGEPSGHHFEADAHFVYLTGITDEPGSMVLFDPSHEDPDRRIVLFLKPINPELDLWDGYRSTISAALREKYGFATVLRTTHLPEALLQAARRNKKLACLHTFGNMNQNVSHDLATFRKVTERVVGVGIEDRTSVLPAMRSVKSAAEIALIRHAVDVTAAGYKAAMKPIKLGLGERAIQHALEDTYRALGASGTAYDSIVGSGLNGTVLHYHTNDGPTNKGELLVIDSGAKFGGYCADITRTYPIGGRFTSDQRDLYEIVLTAQLASIKAARPGATMTDVNNATKAVFEKHGYLDFYPHGIGHHLGLVVHDANPFAKLEPGMVITIEPGIYLQAQKMGVRIEDDVLITRGGNEVLSSHIPKTVKDVEAAIRG